MKADKKFEIILAKNRLARTIKAICKDNNIKLPNTVISDLTEIEKVTGTANQPTAENILTSNMDI